MEKQGVRRPCRPGARRRGLRLCAGVLIAAACSTPASRDEIPSAESYYTRGLEMLEGRSVLFFFRDVDYEGAIQHFQEVIDNYPYSDFATLAELKIADVYFEQERYEEAASYFQDFVEMHPTHPQVPYAIYRRGLCSFNRMRAVDQDPGPTQEALSQFQALLDRHPASEYAEDARQRIGEAENRLAAHGLGVADFYFARGDYYAAESRYREALESYPSHRDRLRTLYRLALCLRYTRREPEAKAILRSVLESAPDDDLAEDAEQALRDMNGSAD